MFERRLPVELPEFLGTVQVERLGLPKVRSDIREYLKEQYVLKEFAFSNIFDPVYKEDFLFFGGIKIGLFEEMYGGIGGEFLFRDIRKPWYVSPFLVPRHFESPDVCFEHTIFTVE